VIVVWMYDTRCFENTGTKEAVILRTSRSYREGQLKSCRHYFYLGLRPRRNFGPSIPSPCSNFEFKMLKTSNSTATVIFHFDKSPMDIHDCKSRELGIICAPVDISQYN